MGLMSAVIHRDDHDRDTISTVFWLNLAMALALLGLLAVAAPALGRLHGHPVVATMLLAYGGKLVFQNVYAIPTALLRRELRFKELSVIRVVANVAEFGGKVGFAAAGFSVWAFVLGPLARVVVTGVGIQLRRPWRPTFALRLDKAKEYVRYGWQTSASDILFHFYTNVDYQIVGYFFGTAANGLYRAAHQLVLEPVRFLSNVVVEIAFPVFSRLRDQRAQLVEQFLAFARLNLLVILPFTAIVLLVPTEALQVFIGSEWTGAATAARILCFVAILRVLSFPVPPLLNGMGFPSLTLLYMAVAAAALPAAYVGFATFLGAGLGYLSVAIAWAVGYPIAFLVLGRLALTKLDLSAALYLRAIVRVGACAVLATGAGALARWALQAQPPTLRFAAVGASVLLVMWLGLPRLGGVDPRAALRALRGADKRAGLGRP
jgi:O-antigen/teichoic acid export membrane protein